MSSGRGLGGRTDLSETLNDVLIAVARFVMWAGVVCASLSVLLLVFTYFKLNGTPTAAEITSASGNVALAAKVLSVSMGSVGVGASYLFWGEEIFGVILLLISAALFFAPMYFPMALGEAKTTAQGEALSALQQGGAILGIIAAFVTIIDIAGRVRDRTKHGSKAENLKYGKGIQEE